MITYTSSFTDKYLRQDYMPGLASNAVDNHDEQNWYHSCPYGTYSGGDDNRQISVLKYIF